MRKLDLPIFEIQQSLLEALQKQKRLILTAPTGSGKSTQVPQMLLDGRNVWGLTGIILRDFVRRAAAFDPGE